MKSLTMLAMVRGEFTPQRLADRIARDFVDYEHLPWCPDAKDLPTMVEQT